MAALARQNHYSFFIREAKPNGFIIHYSLQVLSRAAAQGPTRNE